MNVKGLLTMIVMLLFSLVSCSSEESATVGSGDTISGDAGKILIVYFSWGGNTRMVANHIHDLVGCDIVEVETVIPYPDSYEGGNTNCPRRVGERLSPGIENKGREHGRVRHADCRNPHLGWASYPGHEELSGRLRSVGKVHSTLLYAWWQWHGSKRVRYPFGMPQLDITRQFGRVWKPG